MPKDLKNSHVALCLGAWLTGKPAGLLVCFVPIRSFVSGTFLEKCKRLQAHHLVYDCSPLHKDLLCLIISHQEKKLFELPDLKEPLLSTKT